MKTMLPRITFAAVIACLVPMAGAQGISSNIQPTGTIRELLAVGPVNVGWLPKTVAYDPDESNLIVTACTDPRQATSPMRCTILRYRLVEQRWETLPGINSEANYDDVAYTWDGQAIFAQEYARCEGTPADNPQRQYCSRLVLLDRNGKKLKNLTQEPHNTYAFPSLTRDGTRILYWGVSNELVAGMGGGAWDVKELDIATQRTVQKTDYQAAFPKTTPRYMPDGKRLMLVAEEYPKRPNGQDFLKPDPITGKLREVYYVSKFGRNMTVVVDGPRVPVLPYFPTLKKMDRDGQEVWEPVTEHMWLIVRDVSRDGTLAVFDNRGIGMCFRFINEPLHPEECFTKKVAYTPSVSIAPSQKVVAVVNGADKPNIYWHLCLIDVTTGEIQIIGLRLPDKQ